MKIKHLELDGLILVEAQIFRDHRGFFMERFQENDFAKVGLPTRFIQDNHSRSHPGVIRGLHYQRAPMQGKFVAVVRGRVLDVCVDIRADSPTYGKSIGVEISSENGHLLWIPPGFAHGFCVLGDEPADLWYKTTELYNPKGEGGLLWNDPDLAIQWPNASPLISPRDEKLQTFAEYKKNPVIWKS